MTAGSFSLDRYGDLIAAFSDKGYTIVEFADLRPDSQHLVLRHDIDFDLEAAAKMAEFETKRGIRATYCILLRTEFYNIFSAGAQMAIRRIADAGHEIGLHFDAALYSGDMRALTGAAQAECQILGQAIQGKIKVLSFHRPQPDLFGADMLIDGVLNAYGRRFFEEIGYCSDSRGAWHHGHPLEHPSVSEGGALQLLTHPIWWAGGEGRNAQDTIAHLLATRQTFMASEASRHCSAYRSMDADE